MECTRCPRQLIQGAFPRARGLNYLKTCDNCTRKLAANRERQRDVRALEISSTLGSNARPARKGPEARGTELPMQLAWPKFIVLVAEHKSVALELDTEINLEGSRDGSIPANREKVVNEIADAVWKATEYRFLSVTHFMI